LSWDDNYDVIVLGSVSKALTRAFAALSPGVIDPSDAF